MGTGLILAAPSSGSGKTTLTLGLLRALSRRGVAVRGAKSGPDYIDPRFHEAACGAPCPNLDAWAMGPDRLRSLASGDGLLLIEGAMGLFDGAPPDGRGATADLARLFHLPVVLVVDASKTAQSVAPLVAGFAHYDPRVHVAGVILNKVGSDRHEAMLRVALAPLGLPVLGALHRQSGMAHPSRHLGLVQADEREDLDGWLDEVAVAVAEAVDLDALTALAQPLPDAPAPTLCPAPGKHIAVAHDRAFAFAYPHLMHDWQAAGATVTRFSPLADEAPDPQADFIYLPGGYPELHGATLAAVTNFKAALKSATCPIYGECGGFMVLGNTITDAEGVVHEMLGLLDLDTSFAKRKLHLGYRHVTATQGPFPGAYTAHEFHYATVTHQSGTPLFTATDATGSPLAPMGLIRDKVAGSFAHLIDRDEGFPSP